MSWLSRQVNLEVEIHRSFSIVHLTLHKIEQNIFLKYFPITFFEVHKRRESWCWQPALLLVHAHFFMLWKCCICQTIRGSVPSRASLLWDPSLLWCLIKPAANKTQREVERLLMQHIWVYSWMRRKFVAVSYGHSSHLWWWWDFFSFFFPFLGWQIRDLSVCFY